MKTQMENMGSPGLGGAEHEGTEDLLGFLDERMSEIPDNQKEFVLDHLVPEVVGVLGIILGKEAIEYFAPFTDPSKTMKIVPREDRSPQQSTPPPPDRGPVEGNPEQGQGPSPMMAPGPM